eukprot:scaffold656457_cov162-Prasinocladus_malaysianus.AAC.1
MGIVAGLLVQNALKYLLNFGSVSFYLGYNSLKDFFPSYAMRPNPQCSNSLCCKAQAAYAERMASPEMQAAMAAEKSRVSADQAPVHDDNEWGITVETEEATPPESGVLPEGTGLQFEMPAASGIDLETLKRQAVEQSDANVEDLMKQLESMNADC